MATTQYQIFVRYLNEDINKTLTNKTEIEWISAESIQMYKKAYTDSYTVKMDNDTTAVSRTGKEIYEIIYNEMNNSISESSARRLDEYSIVLQNIYNDCDKYLNILDNIEKKKAVTEYCMIRPVDSCTNDTTGSMNKAAKLVDQILYDYIIDESYAANPKYDMVFMYDGLAQTDEQPIDILNIKEPTADVNPPQNDATEVPYLYYERMKRIQMDPWFFFSIHNSLASAMAKAKTLVNILGKNAVKIGKVVPLDQYIEIV